MKKNFFKKPLFWILIVLVLLATPTAIKVFELYVYSPQTEPTPEDFYIRDENPPFQGFQPAPKEDVEIFTNNKGQTVVEAHKDGYSLILDSPLKVSTWELETGVVKVYDENYCEVSIGRIPEKNVDDFEKRQRDYFNSDDYDFELIRYDITKINDSKINAYMETYENDVFGVNYSVLIQGDDEVFSIVQTGGDYPKCSLMTDVLRGFIFK